MAEDYRDAADAAQMERVMEELPALCPVDRGVLWVKLRLSGNQVAAHCGVSPRQVKYWTAHGYLTPVQRDPVRYNGNALDCCLLIKQGLNQGWPLRRAVAAARDCLAREQAAQDALTALDPATRQALAQQLDAAQRAVATVRDVIKMRLRR